MSERIGLTLLIIALSWLGCSAPEEREDASHARATTTVAATAPTAMPPSPTASEPSPTEPPPTPTPTATATATPIPTATPTLPPSAWLGAGELGPGEAFVLEGGAPRRAPLTKAAEGRLVVDLSDDWAPFLLGDSSGPGQPSKPNSYRSTFVALANDRADPDEILFQSAVGRDAVLRGVPPEERSTTPGALSPVERRALARAESWLGKRREPNYLEVYGIPPTLSVLARRVAGDVGKPCYRDVDVAAFRALEMPITYQSHDQAARDHERWLADAAPGADVSAERAAQARARLAAVRAVQQRLVCEGHLRGKYTPGSFDLDTHLALAAFEKKNHVFGWGFISGETRETLLRDPLELHLDTLRRILAERVADAAAIVEDGSIEATYVGSDGARRPVPDLVGAHVDALLEALGVTTPGELARFLSERGPDSFAEFRVAFSPPPLPPYYAPRMKLAAEIDRGDIWYDPPFDAAGQPVAQVRRRFPHFTLFVEWNGQKIPLVRWRTTIGSWRSELHEDGQVYLKYKNSDVGPRIWKHVVAAPVWVPPQSTPASDLLTRKVFDPRQGPVTVVNTEVIGPGYASAYGLGMVIHLQELGDGRLYDNLIRTHGSADYTSIARRFSHGCHRLVNNRAVRLFDFILQRRDHRRLGDRSMEGYRRRVDHEGETYRFELETRGYYYELVPPIPIAVTEGRVLGETKQPIQAYLRKPGVEYAAPPTAPTPPPNEPVATR